MKKELEAMTKEQLVEVCNHYNLYQPETMTKKKMINKILELNHISTKETPDVKIKTTNSNKLYMFAFVLIILLQFVMTVSQIFTTYYFNDDVFTHQKHTIYGSVLIVASFAWSVYVFYSWLKSGTLNIFMAIMMLLGVGWYIFFMINYHKDLKNADSLKLLYKDKTHIINTYQTMFWVWVGITSSITVLSATTFAIRKIMY